MKTRTSCKLLTAAVLLAAGEARAVPLPIVNPGFDATVTGVGFIYGDPGQEVFYFEGNPMPDRTFTNDGDISAGDNISGLGDSATGAPIADAAVTIFGYTGSPGSGLVHDTRDYLPGEGPDGPGAVISYADNNPRGIFQTLTGTPFQPNTTYTFTAEVSDRRFGPTDNVSFPNGGAVVPTGVHLSLVGDVEQSTGALTFTPPPAGGTSLARLVFTTGPVGKPGDPTGDITLIIRAQGFAGLAATQVMLDNLTLDATPAAPAADADFDGDNDVDGADLLIWQRGVGVGTTQPAGDANFSGGVNGADLAIWRSEFGTPQTLRAATAVPEPTSYRLLLGAFGIALLRIRDVRSCPSRVVATEWEFGHAC